MKFVTYFKTSLFIKIAISIILITLISQSLAAKVNTAENSPLITMKRVHSTRFAEENSTLRTKKRFLNKELSKRRREHKALTKKEEAATALKKKADDSINATVCKKKGNLNGQKIIRGLIKLPIDLSGEKVKNLMKAQMQKLFSYLKKRMPTKFHKIITGVWESSAKPIMEWVPTNFFPNLILGDFNTTTIVNSVASKNSKCSEFPLPENKSETMSVIGFSLGALPCPKVLNAAFCLIYDKCGTYGFSISGGTMACLLTIASAGVALPSSPFIESIGHMQTGYSPTRQWEKKMQLMDIKSDKEIGAMPPMVSTHKELLDLKIRSHVYVGAQVEFPKTSISCMGKDLSEIYALKIYGNLLVDFGPENPFSENKYEEIINDKSLSATQKFSKFAEAAVEFSAVAKGTLELKLAGITNQVIGDLLLTDIVDLNVLISKKGTGSSGMPTGLHLYFKPTLINPIAFIQGNLVKTLTLALKMHGKFVKDAKISEFSFKGSEFGISLGSDNIRFKLNVVVEKKSIFSLKCVLTTKSFSDYDLDCDFDGNLVQIIKTGVNLLVKYAWTVIEDVKVKYERVVSFGVEIKDTYVQIYDKMKKKVITDWEKTKLFSEGLVIVANNKIKEYERGIRKFTRQFNDCLQNIQKFILLGGEVLKHYYTNIVNKIEQDLKKLGNDIYNAANIAMESSTMSFNFFFNPKQFKKNRDDFLLKRVEMFVLRKQIINKVIAEVEIGNRKNPLAEQKKLLKSNLEIIERFRKYLAEL